MFIFLAPFLAADSEARVVHPNLAAVVALFPAEPAEYC